MDDLINDARDAAAGGAAGAPQQLLHRALAQLNTARVCASAAQAKERRGKEHDTTDEASAEEKSARRWKQWRRNPEGRSSPNPTGESGTHEARRSKDDTLHVKQAPDKGTRQTCFTGASPCVAGDGAQLHEQLAVVERAALHASLAVGAGRVRQRQALVLRAKESRSSNR